MERGAPLGIGKFNREEAYEERLERYDRARKS
jgi:hypothetical protein